MIFNFKNQKGFTFVQTLIGLFILLLIFIGLYGSIQIAFKIISQSKAQVIASSLAVQKIESIRNLSYQNIGTAGGIPAGNIQQTSTTTINNIDYTIEIDINYVDDDFDGLAPTDTVPNDYKRVRVEISWPGFFGDKIVSVTDITPPGLESSVGGGNLSVSVFDANGQPIPQANIHIINNKINPAIDTSYETNDNGQYLIAGAPTSTNAYEITISKDGYNSSQTYSSTTVANPNNPHATVLESALTSISFSIDKLSSFSINTLSPWGSGIFSDSFVDNSKVSETSDIQIYEGNILLATTTASTTQYKSSGYVISDPIQPASLINWQELTWNDTQTASTSITYQLYYATTSSWEIIPNSELSGNESGFESSPVDLTDIPTDTYYNVKIKANLSTNISSTTPSLSDWHLSWKTDIPTPIEDVDFNLQGQKTIGTDENDDPVYKYSRDFSTDSNGHIDINDLEWDLYNFTIDPSEDLSLTTTTPPTNPLGENVSLEPDTNQNIDLYLDAENNLMVTIQNSDTSETVFNAQVRLYNSSLGYDEIQYTNEDGQTLYSPLEPVIYNIEIQKTDYENYTGNMNVTGDTTKTINLTPSGPS